MKYEMTERLACLVLLLFLVVLALLVVFLYCPSQSCPFNLVVVVDCNVFFLFLVVAFCQWSWSFCSWQLALFLCCLATMGT